jgi:hypothetical protein
MSTWAGFQDNKFLADLKKQMCCEHIRFFYLLF